MSGASGAELADAAAVLAGNPVVAELTRALLALGCESTDHAGAVLDAAPVELTDRERVAVLVALPRPGFDPAAACECNGGPACGCPDCGHPDCAYRPGVRYRWTDHRNDRGTWCRWSHVSVSVNLAAGADKRCPFACVASSIEVDPRPVDDPE